MAVSKYAIWEVQSSGNDNNGGAFVEGASGTDLTYPTSSPITFSGTLSASGTTTLTDSGSGFTSSMVGNLINITAGGGMSTGRYELVSFTDTSNVVLDRTPGTGSGGSGIVGGALASPGGFGAATNDANVAVWGQRCYIKGGATYTMTTTTENVAGGPLNLTSPHAFNNQNLFIAGYTSTRGDNGLFVFDCDTQTCVYGIRLGGNSAGSHWLENVELDGGGFGGLTHLLGSSSSPYNSVYNFSVHDGNNDGISNMTAMYGETYNHDRIGYAGRNAVFVRSYNNGLDGFGTLTMVSHCIADGNARYGFSVQSATVVNCVAYNNSNHGFILENDDRRAVMSNCISYGNAGYGFGVGLSVVDGACWFLQRCAYGNNTNDNTDFVLKDEDPVTLTADPFTNAASGDFSLNNTAGGGALLRGRGFAVYGQIPVSGNDIGAVIEQYGGGGGGSSTTIYSPFKPYIFGV